MKLIKNTNMTPPALSELEDFVAQQAAEDAFLTNGKRYEQEELVKELLREQVDDPVAVQELFEKYLGSLALYRGEKAESNQETSIPLDLSQIGWLKDQIGKDGSIVRLIGEHIEAPQLSFDFVDFTGLDGVTKECQEKVLAQNINDQLMTKLTQHELPVLWDDIKSGRGRQRPISAGNNSRARAGSSGRPLDTIYPGYKLYLKGDEIAAIVLILGKNTHAQPQFGLAALYDQKNQEKIWGELMNRSSHGRH
jgi:CHAT domain-containing protein